MRFSIARVASLVAIAWTIAYTAAASHLARAQDQLVYVKKDSREATRQASLEASGAIRWPSTWQLIGPFDNTDGSGLDKVYPPEQEIKLDATYEGKGEKARWRGVNLRDGLRVSLARFKTSDDCLCYVYRKVESPKAMKVQVSIGSENKVVGWLNGTPIIFTGAGTRVAMEQDTATLDLREGANDLLIKVAHRKDKWNFYFNPLVAARFQVKLDRLLDRDFPPKGEAEHYRIESLPLASDTLIEVGGLAFRPDGKLYVATRRGDIWLVSNPTAENVDEISWKRFAVGLHEPLGILPEGNHSLYVMQRPEMTVLRDTNEDDVADEYDTVCDRFGISGNYHEFAYGPVRNGAGDFFGTLNLGFSPPLSEVPFRGCVIKIDRGGGIVPWAFGLRSPNGVAFDPAGRLFYTDNQGEYIPVCKLQEVRQGEFYGHKASLPWMPNVPAGETPEVIQPAIWFPLAVARSTAEPVWDTTDGRFGPFAGQCLVAELTNSLILRCTLEEVKGRWQGACIGFRSGFQSGVNRLVFAPDGTLFVGETNRGWGSLGGQTHGLQRVLYTGNVPFEILSMNVTPEGWDLKFTRPIDKSKAADPAHWFLESYTYHYWDTYGSPEIERRENKIEAIHTAEDGLSARLIVPERDLRRVYHLQLKDMSSADGAKLLHPDAYYTLNELP
ncbi:MAG TPA: hypothetical protein VHD36_19480 [Pirellulales bacterium]|nr:hypothetical protein [Pirellulales bacterium]